MKDPDEVLARVFPVLEFDIEAEDLAAAGQVHPQAGGLVRVDEARRRARGRDRPEGWTIMTDADPYVFYTVMRRSLDLSVGKAVAQGQHAMDYLAREVERLTELPIMRRTEEERERLAAFYQWRQTPDHTKVVLGATDDEFFQVLAENPGSGKWVFLVTDLGRTEVAPDTQTCVGLWPMRKSSRSPILRALKRL
jgi:peptidyl-tRNA hydrolase